MNSEINFKRRAWSTEEMQERQHKYRIAKFHGMWLNLSTNVERRGKDKKQYIAHEEARFEKNYIISSDKLNTN